RGRAPAADLRTFLPDRRRKKPRQGRHRPGAGDLQTHRGSAWPVCACPVPPRRRHDHRLHAGVPAGLSNPKISLHLQAMTTTQVFDYSKWTAQLPELSRRYQSAKPYPHIVLENFLDPDVLKDCIAEFNRLNETDGWINYKHYNEDKRGLNKIDLLPDTIRSTINELNSPAFLQWLGTITGIANLQKDDGLEGGGIHQSTRGGFLNIHADFTVHPHHRNWQRRVNVLVYLNKDWEEDWGGKLELWDKKMKACEESVLPVYNR